MSHWHLTVLSKDGTSERWCGDSFAEVQKTLTQYLEPARIEARPLKYGRGYEGKAANRWGCPPNRMPKVEQ